MPETRAILRKFGGARCNPVRIVVDCANNSKYYSRVRLFTSLGRPKSEVFLFNVNEGGKLGKRGIFGSAAK